MVDCLSSMHKALASFPSTLQTELAEQACNPSSGEIGKEGGRIKVQGHCQLHSQVEADLGYLKLSLKKREGRERREERKGKSDRISEDIPCCAVILWTLRGTFTCE